MGDGFKEAARIAASELGIEKTPEEWEFLARHWVAEYRASNPKESESMSDVEVFARVVENTRAQMEKSESNMRIYEQFVQNAPTDSVAEQFLRTFLAGFAKNCPMELLIRLSKIVARFRRSQMNFSKGD